MLFSKRTVCPFQKDTFLIIHVTMSNTHSHKKEPLNFRGGGEEHNTCLCHKLEHAYYLVDPLSPHDALKHHFTTLKTQEIPMKLVYQYMAIFFNL